MDAETYLSRIAAAERDFRARVESLTLTFTRGERSPTESPSEQAQSLLRSGKARDFNEQAGFAPVFRHQLSQADFQAASTDLKRIETFMSQRAFDRAASIAKCLVSTLRVLEYQENGGAA